MLSTSCISPLSRKARSDRFGSARSALQATRYYPMARCTGHHASSAVIVTLTIGRCTARVVLPRIHSTCVQRRLNSIKPFDGNDCIDRTTRLATCMSFVHHLLIADHLEDYATPVPGPLAPPSCSVTLRLHAMSPSSLVPATQSLRLVHLEARHER